MAKASENIYPKVRMSTTVSSAAPSGGEWRFEARANGFYAVSSNTGAAGTGPFGAAGASYPTTLFQESTANVTPVITVTTDVTGASITCAAGTWDLDGAVTVAFTGATVGYIIADIADSANTVVGRGRGVSPALAAANEIRVPIACRVTPASSTTYKLRIWIEKDGSTTRLLGLTYIRGIRVA